jgi:hypothetical protein
MPVHTSGFCNGHVCAIVGTYARGASVQNAVDHVGLLVEECSIDFGHGQPVQVHEMLREGLKTNQLIVNLLGVMKDLDPAEITKLEQWTLEMLRCEHQQYHVLPASIVTRMDTTSGTITEVQFSCAGFVERCYRDAAGIRLLVDESSLPPIALQALCSVWSDRARALQSTKIRKRYGLHGPEPWPILMPGYLFHAIRHVDAHGREAGPYQPQSGDWRFAPR